MTKLILTSLFLLTSVHAGARVSTDLKCLWAAYKNFKISADGRNLVFEDGTVMPFENRDRPGTPLDPENPTSIDQMFLMPYPFGFRTDANGKKTYKIPSIGEDPGRIRYEPFLLKTYGDHPDKIKRDLVVVPWAPDNSTVRINRRFGAAQALERISTALGRLTRARPEMLQYVQKPLGGTFNWRKVSGTNNLSVHAFGVAMDINLDKTDYWKWNQRGPGPIKYKNRIPPEVAEIFEQNGFIWGGKWYHYDTMHFEYRPELIMNRQACEREFLKYRD